MWITLKTYALGCISLGVNGSLVWYHPFGLNLITAVSLGGIAATLLLMGYARRLNSSS